MPAPARLLAQPHAIERLLATPKTIPVLPARIGSKNEGSSARVGGRIEARVRLAFSLGRFEALCARDRREHAREPRRLRKRGKPALASGGRWSRPAPVGNGSIRKSDT